MEEINKNVVLLCSKLIQLVLNKNIVVPHEEVNALVNLGAFFGIIVHGGAFISDSYQCLYID